MKVSHDLYQYKRHGCEPDHGFQYGLVAAGDRVKAHFADAGNAEVGFDQQAAGDDDQRY